MDMNMGTIKFACPSCGSNITAPQETAGKRGKCLTCGTIVEVPPYNASAGQPQPAAPVSVSRARHYSASASSPGAEPHDVPSSITRWPPWVIFVLVESALVVVAGMLGAILQSSIVFGLSLLAVVVLTIACWLHVFLAKSRAFHNDVEDASLFGGLVRMILWNPTQGILLLKNKQIDFVDSNINDGGGVKFIIPALGQEVGLRVPLTVLTTEIVNEKVYTRDSVPLDMKMTVWWKIADLRQFYLSVSREVHLVNDAGSHIRREDAPPGFRGEGLTYACREQLETAESWIRISMEEEARQFASSVSTSLLVSDKIASQLLLQGGSQPVRQLPVPAKEQDAVDSPGQSALAALGEYQMSSHQLINQLQSRLDSFVRGRGLAIDKIALQEVKLPDEILRKAVDAAKAWYGAIEAHRQGVGMAAQLEELSKILGKDTLSIAHVLERYQGTNVSVGISGILDTVFAKLGQAKV
jgi:hypothetical protein